MNVHSPGLPPTTIRLLGPDPDSVEEQKTGEVPLTVAYMAGRGAARNGKALSANPYTPLSETAAEWAKGWHTVQAERGTSPESRPLREIDAHQGARAEWLVLAVGTFVDFCDTGSEPRNVRGAA